MMARRNQGALYPKNALGGLNLADLTGSQYLAATHQTGAGEADLYF